MYNPASKKAEEFINHEEILATLNYAEENKHNEVLITELIEKAKLRKGLSHREASVLLACDIEEKNQEIYALAEQIKKDFYGNRIVMFAPLYLSNYCINGCTYCPYHMKNKHIARKKLTQEEIRKEVIALQDMGHKRFVGVDCVDTESHAGWKAFLSGLRARRVETLKEIGRAHV